MAYDTFLRGEDEMARRMRPVYGSPPSGVSSEQAASEDAARRFARRRLLMSLQGGLGAGVQAGEGFFGNLTRGLSGSLGGTLQANQMQHEEERQSIQDAAAARQEERLNRSRQEQEAAAFENILLRRGSNAETARHNQVMEGRQPQQPRMSPLEFFLKDPQGYAKFMAAGREPKSALSGRPELKDLNTLSDNFRQDKDVQNFTVVRDYYKRIVDTTKLDSGQGDLATIFSFMKVLDPTSVVRETEFANAAQAVGRLQQTMNIPSQWVKGNRLTPEGRAGFRRAAKDIFDTQRKTYRTKADLYRRQAQSYKVDPTLIIPEYDDGEGIGDSAGDPLDAYYK